VNTPTFFAGASVVTVRDVTLSTHDDVQAFRQKLARIMLDGMYQFVGLLDQDGNTLEVNRPALEGAGIRLEDIQGKPFWDARWWQVSAETRQRQREFVRRAGQGEFVRCKIEIFGEAAGDETIVIDYSLAPVRDQNDRVVFLLAEGRNVTAQIRAEAEIARQHQELDRLTDENVYFEGEIRRHHRFDEIIGRSPVMRAVLDQVETVAPTDATVLLLGETGTGKEALARAIHKLSTRQAQMFVRLNCAAIPATLVEAELFGHERGAFTGAIASRAGRLEVANRGTLFLDEVGDLAPDVQPKLLRVLQEQEFERVGSSRTVKVDVRLIAATNQDLQSLVEEGDFRSDLYYRLNVFPIRLPPLRERRQDIPLLTRHFVKQWAARMNRRIETIPEPAMTALVRWDWPGNIRELQNVIERAVILSSGAVLNVPIADLTSRALSSQSTIHGRARLADVERQTIVTALRESNGVVSGPTGAAARLGLKRTTLQARMRKLGIKRPTY
jgi:formate hydrogenlyase transcriptional activator